MFNSGISVSSLVKELKNEVDIALPIPNADYVLWENELEQLLYSEIIKEQREISYAFDSMSFPCDVESLNVKEDENTVRFEDVYTVFADDVQLIKSTLTSGVIFPNTFYKVNCCMGINTDFEPQTIKIIYFVKPALKTVDENDSVSDGYVMLPIEFIDLVKAKLRGEAYKIANEDAIAAKWINDYNILVETFKNWIKGKTPSFGM